jgi:dTDP-4-dehydrorhamnose 3,5-epimerase
MKLDYFDLSKLKNYKLIKDVKVYPLKVNRDKRGILVETLKTNWSEIYDPDKYPFTQNYFSLTDSNTARDEDRWHIHPAKQADRFVVPLGRLVVALFDPRENSPTFKKLNLFKMGEWEKDLGYYNLLIPRNVMHGFLVASKKRAMILNFPNALYDPEEEGRVAFKEVEMENGKPFSWNMVRKDFNLPLKENKK